MIKKAASSAASEPSEASTNLGASAGKASGISSVRGTFRVANAFETATTLPRLKQLPSVTSPENAGSGPHVTPPRTTWESIIFPDDPILGQKMQPHVIERRARFRKIVKGTLGACVLLCVAALAVSLLASCHQDSKPGAAANTPDVKTAPASAVVTVEELDGAPRGKASKARSVAARAAAKATLARQSLQSHQAGQARQSHQARQALKPKR